MSKFTFKEIKDIIECTPKELHLVEIVNMKAIKVGYYHPSNANWNYEVYVVLYNGCLVKVVTTFGSIRG